MDLDVAKEGGRKSAATHTRFEELPPEQINNSSRNASKAVSSGDNADPDSAPKARTKDEVYSNFAVTSKTDGTKGDSKLEEQKRKKRRLSKKEKLLGGSEVALDRD